MINGCRRFIAAAGFIVSLALVGGTIEADTPPEPTPARPSNGSGGKFGTFKAAKIEVGRKSREFRLVVEQSAFDDGPAPLVFAYHGLLDSPDLMSFYSQLDRLAKKEDFVLVYPKAENRYWPLVPGLERNDLAFHDALYQTISAKYNIDLNRIYITGMSNGAYFSHLIAKQRSDQIAAIAPHSGGLGSLYGNPLKLEHKYAVFAIHGDADGIVKVEEGRRIKEYYEKWEHPVEYLEVKGLNHFWAHKAKVNEKIWEFFEAHPLVGVE